MGLHARHVYRCAPRRSSALRLLVCRMARSVVACTQQNAPPPGRPMRVISLPGQLTRAKSAWKPDPKGDESRG